MSSVNEPPLERRSPDGASDRGRLLPRDLFEKAEHIAYLVIGTLLSLTAAVALAGAALLLWQGLHDWSEPRAAFEIVDRLLFVLMLIEILHTVRASIQSGGLAAEPFLVVGLIASIRRVLVITLESSEAMRMQGWTEGKQEQFRASMVELGVLGALILIMVVSIYVLHRSIGREAATSA